MPTLLELQRAMHASLLDRNDGPAAAMLAENVRADRLNIYRNTFVTGVTKALRLSFPAVHRLVGDDFFAGAAALFIAQHPPRSAYLDEYGADFAQFLSGFEPAASLEYLADVARLEWAVNRAIHASDMEPLDLARLEALAPEDQARVSFVPHSSIGLLCVDYPVDAIWRGVLGRDDAALAAVDLTSGPVCLLVERRATGIEVSRLDVAAWRFAHALCEGRPLVDVFAACSHFALPRKEGQSHSGEAFTSPRLRGEVGICALVAQIPGEGAAPQALSGEFALAQRPPRPDPLPASGEREQSGHEVWLAEHLAAGRFVDFHLIDSDLAPRGAKDVTASSEAML